MHLKEVEQYRAEKDFMMRNGDMNINDIREKWHRANMQDNQRGIDQDAHGSELQ